VDQLRELLAGAAGPVVALTGAGLSTDSGIPDYRGPSGALRRHTPMTYQSFMTDPVARHRYWARSYLGWQQLAAARPNAGHRAVAALQQGGRVADVITQNVDGLHQAAGARDVVELHGGLSRTICLHCGDVASRVGIDERLREANPSFGARVRGVNPDGDADLADGELDGFVMVSCVVCGLGPIKPDVVFFGETVPRVRVERCFELVDRAGALLVLGSSLQVMSGYRFVVRAARRGIPIAIVNRGPTRGDGHASVKLDASLSDVLCALSSV
jgi:NAD-dependent SIR2 family protein deacetylase